jgi:hypothetical protein
MMTRRIFVLLAARPILAPGQQANRLFTFRNGFWLNLHHFMYVLGRAKNKTTDSTRGAVAGARSDKGNGKDPTGEWGDAILTYSQTISKQDVLFDRDASAITSRIAALADDATLPDDMDARLRDALAQAEPHYRRVWWNTHSESNQRFIRGLESMLDRYGKAMEEEISRAYQESWPSGGFTIDVCAYAVWAGAYSTSRGLIVLASTDAAMAGTQAIESVFHESMHQWDDDMQRRIRNAARAAGVKAPNSLSHSLIFHTAGYVASKVIPGHQPYAKVNGLWTGGAFVALEKLDLYWLPYLEGKVGLSDALRSLLTA